MSADVRFERLLAEVLADTAPTRAPDGLVPDILAAASHARRRPRWLALATERPMRFQAGVAVGSRTMRVAYMVLLALLLALLVAATLVVGGISPRPANFAVTIPQRSLAATPADCMTDHVTLLPASSATPFGLEDSASLTSPNVATGVYAGLDTGKLWIAGGGRAAPFNFATIKDGEGVEVLDVSPDRTRALVRVWRISLGGHQTECGDLYEFAVDGSRARRLTFFSTGRIVMGAAYSPDGKAVAYGVDIPDGGHLIVMPDAGDPLSYPCEISFGADPAVIDWSPDGTHVATICSRSIGVFDANGGSSLVDIAAEEVVYAFTWRDASTLLVAVGPWGENPGGFTLRAHDATERAPATVILDVDASIPSIAAHPNGISPDGRSVFATGGTPSAAARYLISTADGATSQVLVQGQDFLGWTKDSSAFLYLDHAPEGGAAGPRDLVRLEASSKRADVIGTWTTGCACQGIWRAP
jgi:hypothetical protein